jgi:conjugal transfer/entry exclusion protein
MDTKEIDRKKVERLVSEIYNIKKNVRDVEKNIYEQLDILKKLLENLNALQIDIIQKLEEGE